MTTEKPPSMNAVGTKIISSPVHPQVNRDQTAHNLHPSPPSGRCLHKTISIFPRFLSCFLFWKISTQNIFPSSRASSSREMICRASTAPALNCHWPRLERWECENAMRSDKRLCTLTLAPSIVIESLADDWAMDAGRVR